MAETQQINLRLSTLQLKQLEKLSRKMALDRSSLIRLAIARLWEEEAKRNPERG